MPIQFRCGSCNQLLGIATRKAGHVVNCPTCGNKTIVPRPSPVPAKSPQPALAAVGAGAVTDEPRTTPEVQAALAAEPEEPIGISMLDKVDVDALLAPPKPGQAVKAAPVPEPKQDVAPAAPRPRNKILEMTALPSEELESLDEMEAPSNPQFTLVLTPGLTAFLLVLFIALLAGVLLLGMWLGSRFAA